ncbi:alpha/beta hydrolase [Flavobacterium sp. WC2509]|uniref:alpha/beta hydrolase n=1 Tax=Flavobacterium sp. WC2509 TaxID=3461406 RepID=UPI0040444FAF
MTTKKWTVKKSLKTIWITAGLVFTLWLFYSSQSHGIDEQFFHDSNTIKVENTDDFYSFSPKKTFKNVFIFYPGAMVDPKAYVPLCRKIADNNIKVYLIKMPWRLASNGYNKPKELNLFNDTTKTYILSGHSLGAKMAAQFVFENPNLIDKLILIGSSHPKTFSLVDSKVPVLKIYGSNDGVADEKSILDNKSKLPKTTKFVKIEGGNHSQFGYYGFQLGDNQATISREQQQVETLKIILNFINES